MERCDENREPGEVVQAGTAVVTMLDLSKVYLRGFVPEGQIGKVRVGKQRGSTWIRILRNRWRRR